jgi:two-component system sensor histidine kinase/response regulator
MTANAMPSDKEDCLAAGMTDHVGKPFDLQDLIKTLVRHTAWAPVPVVAKTVPDLALQHWPADIAVEAALKRMGGNAGLLQRSMAAFTQDAQALPHRMDTWLAHGDWATAQRELHAFKGLAGTLGIASLAQLAASAEKLAKQHDAAALMPALNALGAQAQALVPLLQQVAEQLLPKPTVSGAAPEADLVAPSADWLLQLKTLHAALLASDMGAMELHAQLRFVPVAALESAMAPLDAAMAELEFALAAVECEKLIQHYAPVTRQ